MIRKMGVEWQLRLRMAEQGMYATSDLVPLLAERGVHLSREQVFRLVTRCPQRLSVDTLAALCDILGCGPNDLLQVKVVNVQVAKTGTGGADVVDSAGGEVVPVRRSTIRRPPGSR